MKFNLKGLNLNMLLLVVILVGVMVVIFRQNNKCVMDEDDDDDDVVEGFGIRNSYSNWLKKIKKRLKKFKKKGKERTPEKGKEKTPMFGAQHSPFATFRGVRVHGFTQLGATTYEPLEKVLTVCNNHTQCQGVMTRGNKKFLINNTDTYKRYTVSDDSSYNTYINNKNGWLEGDRSDYGGGYYTMMTLPGGGEREMNWSTQTTV